MANLLELWCRPTTTTELGAWLAPMLRDAGFEGPLLRSAVETGADAWSVFRLEGGEARASLGRRAEGCVLFSIRSQAGTVGESFAALWIALLRDPPWWVGECILQDDAMEVYPLLIHTFYRLKPVVLVVEEEDCSLRRVAPGDATYWDEVGRRLHFVADALLAEADTPTPARIAELLGARLQSAVGGVVFDCGWTAPRRA